MTVIPVILAGGSGTRLWPFSRELYPKQLLALNTSRSLLQDALERVAVLGAPLVVCNEEHRFHVLEQAAAIGRDLRGVLLEPDGRNTAPALTAAALLLEQEDPVLVMLPADHAVDDSGAFVECLKAACRAAEDGAIATLGVVPSRPETGFGYIHIKEGDAAHGNLARVDGFVEKPDARAAAEYVSGGRSLWNAGVYVIRARAWLKAVRRFCPDVLAACAPAVAGGGQDGAFFRLQAPPFLEAPSVSVDVAVMEPAAADPAFRCVVVGYGGGWSDIGSWRAVWERGQKDAGGNVCAGDVIARDTRDSLLLSGGRLVATLGCRNLVVAETADAVLVADLEASQDLSAFVKSMKGAGREEALVHRSVYRPWGSYELLVHGPRYQVKRLTVKPGRHLSLQRHRQRAEHWVVVRGVASVVRGTERLTLQANESVFIPRGEKHRLGNDGEAVLEVIEVQTGEYLGEDDIERFEDDFGRG